MNIQGNAYLITGGASLIGSHLVDALLAAGAAEVRLLDNFALGSNEMIAHLFGDSRVKLIRGDILRLTDLLEASTDIGAGPGTRRARRQSHRAAFHRGLCQQAALCDLAGMRPRAWRLW